MREMRSKMKLYAITEGDYSAYHIITLCSDRAVAESIYERLKKADEGFEYPLHSYRIEEYTDGKVYSDESMKGYCVRFDGPECEVKAEGEGEIEYCFREDVIWQTNGTIHCLYIFAHNEEEAKKIASERRAKLIAERTGVI